MSREKQIEGKANANDIKGLAELLVDFGRTYDDSIQGLEDILTEAIITAGYRKASDVALEVIDKVELLANNHLKAISMLDPQNAYCAGGKQAFDIILRFVAELKKKYTEDGE